jgi:bifunctional NMN adenylyltransferase/nudix hydrolase
MDAFDVAVLVGQFQPFHRVHQALLSRALTLAPRVVVVLGSARHAPTAKDPFSAAERERMIRATLTNAEQTRVDCVPLSDFGDDAAWCRALVEAVESVSLPRARCVLVGRSFDAASRNLRRLPDWQFVGIDPEPGLDARSLRQTLFEAKDARASLDALAPQVPSAVLPWLATWLDSAEFERLREEHHAIQHALKTYGAGPFVTVDAVVQAADHVLLVQRGRAPGKGLWATPGGFLEPGESLLCGALRELSEETGLALSEEEGETRLRGVAVFAHPFRGLRGRNITHAHHFDLGGGALPEVHGADDAAAAQWIPVTELSALEERFFDDHAHILRHFLSPL